MSTPIFDAVMREQGVDMMPLPPFQTHEDFMRDHQHDEFLARGEAILRGAIKPGNGRNAKGQFVKGGGAPVKKKRRE